MVDFGRYLTISIGIIFVNNMILAKFLGLCPFIGVSKKTKPAFGMGLAVLFVMTMASLITWIVFRYALAPLHLEYLRTITFILVIASFVQFVEIVIRKISPPLFKAFGIYLPLITTNCAVLGIALLNNDNFFTNGAAVEGSFSLSMVQGIAAGIGYIIAMLLMSGIRERLETAEVPRPLQGIAIAFIVAGLISMSFLGFAGFKI